MCLTMLPAALADDEPESEPVAQAEATMSESEFRDQVNTRSYVKLTGNVELTSTLTISKQVTIYLNDYSIIGNFGYATPNNYNISNPSVILVTQGGDLTLADNNANKGKIMHGINPDTGKRYLGIGVGVYGGSFTMNGGTITDHEYNYVYNNNRSYSGAAGGVAVVSIIEAPASFTMNNGVITGNTALGSNYTGGVCVSGTTSSAATFTMTGGTISNNTTNSAGSNVGGVWLSGTTNFTMTGGTITGNTPTGHYSDTPHGYGGVYAASLDTTITVGGTAKIYGNTIAGETNNLNIGQIKSDTISISSGSPLRSDANTGVTTYREPTTNYSSDRSDVAFTAGTNASENDVQYFFSDKGHEVVYKNGRLWMQKINHRHEDGVGFVHKLTSNADGALVIDDSTIRFGRGQHLQYVRRQHYRQFV